MVRTTFDRVAAVAGFGLVIYGVGRLSLEAALIIAGSLLLVAALWPAARKKDEEGQGNG